MQYTELDAFYDILVWQFPVPCSLAMFFTVSLITQQMVAGGPVWWCCPAAPHIAECPTVIVFLCAVSVYVLAWIVVALPILLIDIAVIPAVFAVIRYAGAVGAKIR